MSSHQINVKLRPDQVDLMGAATARQSGQGLAQLLELCTQERRRMEKCLLELEARVGAVQERATGSLDSAQSTDEQLDGHAEPPIRQWLDQRLEKLAQLDASLAAREKRLGALEQGLRGLLQDLTEKIGEARAAQSDVDHVHREIRKQLDSVGADVDDQFLVMAQKYDELSQSLQEAHQLLAYRVEQLRHKT